MTSSRLNKNSFKCECRFEFNVSFHMNHINGFTHIFETLHFVNRVRVLSHWILVVCSNVAQTVHMSAELKLMFPLDCNSELSRDYHQLYCLTCILSTCNAISGSV